MGLGFVIKNLDQGPLAIGKVLKLKKFGHSCFTKNHNVFANNLLFANEKCFGILCMIIEDPNHDFV